MSTNAMIMTTIALSSVDVDDQYLSDLTTKAVLFRDHGSFMCLRSVLVLA